MRVHDNICLELDKHHEVSIENAPVGQDPRLLGVTVSRQSTSRKRSLVANSPKPFRKRYRYDVRVDSAPALSFSSACEERVVVVHDLNYLRPTIHDIKLSQRVYRHILHKWTLSRADRIIAVSAATRDEIVQYMPQTESRIVVLPLPVDHIARTSLESSTPTKSNGTSTSSLTLMTFGHARNKGVERLLQLLALESDWQLRVVCSQLQWEQYWRSEARSLGVVPRVTIADSPSDAELVELYSTSDVFCMLSSYEGYGLPVAEALSLARPVVVSDLRVLRDTSLNGAVTTAIGGSTDELRNAVLKAHHNAPEYWQVLADEIRRNTWSNWVSNIFGADCDR